MEKLVFLFDKEYKLIGRKKSEKTEKEILNILKSDEKWMTKFPIIIIIDKKLFGIYNDYYQIRPIGKGNLTDFVPLSIILLIIPDFNIWTLNNINIPNYKLTSEKINIVNKEQTIFKLNNISIAEYNKYSDVFCKPNEMIRTIRKSCKSFNYLQSGIKELTGYIPSMFGNNKDFYSDYPDTNNMYTGGSHSGTEVKSNVIRFVINKQLKNLQ